MLLGHMLLQPAAFPHRMMEALHSVSQHTLIQKTRFNITLSRHATPPPTLSVCKMVVSLASGQLHPTTLYGFPPFQSQFL